MDFRQASQHYIESDADLRANTSQRHTSEEDFIQINETIQNVSRNMRKGDWAYLCRHPEVRAIIRVIATEAIKSQPQNIYNFAAELFNCTNQKSVCKKINKQIKWIHSQVKHGAWTPADGPMLFPESSSSSINPKKAECGQSNDDSTFDDEPYFKTDMCPDHVKPSC
ncbi:hypothetical protein KR044_012081 [Drosophila immigrans]|nr:hypothetical protein KR044_012081 [Drosophila immigrans]